MTYNPAQDGIDGALQELRDRQAKRIDKALSGLLDLENWLSMAREQNLDGASDAEDVHRINSILGSIERVLENTVVPDLEEK